ncbi:hypothetical protein K2F43_00820 [Clostridium estertheticum]|uniref:hypothetical protein n=1 Tax=Clostridium estertheticum TaxID=238834 RepID=UPI001C6ED36D|nr:hypothetical protein [Clostridium estertheticum]MBW9169743.1 hypothetical protein [Clostridium estertheticum]WLC74750.1 hypothetical protein KTC99_18645 [Clostridium estertheticum]
MIYQGEYPYNYNGEKIVARLSTEEAEYNLSFSYKKVNVMMFWFDSKKVGTSNMIKYLCTTIDIINSQTDFDIFNDYYQKIDFIKSEYITYHDKVYKPKVIDNSKEMINPCILMSIEFENDKPIHNIKLADGSSFNKSREVGIFITNVRNIIKKKNLIPKEEYINEIETKAYKKYLEWFNEKKLYILPNV